MSIDVVILAAGKGTRMHSEKPKVLHAIGGKAMLEHVVNSAAQLPASKLHVVVGFGADAIKAYFKQTDQVQESQHISWATQAEQLGTGHAVAQALPDLDTSSDDNKVLVLYGDVPLIQKRTLEKLLSTVDAETVALLTLVTENPTGLGRIIRNSDNAVVAIVEEKDASAEQKKIQETNSGILAVPARKLAAWLNALGNDNEQGEYYLTDVIAMAVNDGCKIAVTTIDDGFEVQGVNDKKQLAMLERHFQMKNADELMDQGVTLLDPARLDIRGEVHCGKDVEIDVNVILEGKVTIKDGARIGSGVTIKDSVIEEGAVILPGCNMDGAVVGKNSSVGPHARLRPGTVLKENCKLGNFVETKNAIFGNGSKASHLAYVGDAELGEQVNIGAGTIFCNYDGANKYKTTVGNNVFVGSNSVLIAPVTLADNSFVAAGSAINNDVPENSLAIGRGRQKFIEGWKRPTKKTS